jgi:peptidoglycan hydrolase CwlO-like protein
MLIAISQEKKSMDESAAGSVAEWMRLIGATGIGGLIMAFFAKFAFRKMVEEGTATQRAGGETDIIDQLRTEVDRMGKINDTLSGKVAELQEQIIKLRSENAELKAEIQALNYQIKSLNPAGKQ